MIPQPPDLARDPASREQRENFDVFLSRGLPEQYLHWIKSELNHHQIAEHFWEPGEEPAQVVARALVFDEESREKGYQVKSTWCFLEDLSADGLASLAGDTHVMIANSRPSLDLWLLLHFEEVPQGIPRAELARALRQHLPDLRRDIADGALLGRFTVAADRARTLGVEGDLATNVFEFVEQVRDSLVAFSPGATVRI